MSVTGVADESFLGELRAAGIEPSPGAGEFADQIIVAMSSPADLDTLPALSGRLTPTGGIWVVAERGSRSLSEAAILEAGRRAGLVDVKVARFSATHTAHRFVIPKAARAPSLRP